MLNAFPVSLNPLGLQQLALDDVPPATASSASELGTDHWLKYKKRYQWHYSRNTYRSDRANGEDAQY